TRPRSSTGAPAPPAPLLAPDPPTPPPTEGTPMTENDDTTPREAAAEGESPQGVDRKAEAGCPVMHDSATAAGSESENPAIDSPTPKTGGRPHGIRDWWPNQVDLSVLSVHSPKVNPLDPDFDYRAAV